MCRKIVTCEYVNKNAEDCEQPEHRNKGKFTLSSRCMILSLIKESACLRFMFWIILTYPSFWKMPFCQNPHKSHTFSAYNFVSYFRQRSIPWTDIPLRNEYFALLQ